MEEKKKRVLTVTKKYFDKRFFLKKVLVPIGIGVVFWGGGYTLSPNSDTTVSVNSRQFLWAFSETSKIFGIGLSLKGIVNIFRSFKKRRTYKIVYEEDVKAIRYNKLLKKVMEKRKQLVFVRIKLKKIGDTNEK